MQDARSRAKLQFGPVGTVHSAGPRRRRSSSNPPVHTVATAPRCSVVRPRRRLRIGWRRNAVRRHRGASLGERCAVWHRHAPSARMHLRRNAPSDCRCRPVPRGCSYLRRYARSGSWRTSPTPSKFASALVSSWGLGAIAQLVERFHGMEEVRGSIPLSSTRATCQEFP